MTASGTKQTFIIVLEIDRDNKLIHEGIKNE